MIVKLNARRALLGTTGLCLACLTGAPALAQEGQGGFLGTITLGESKREVRTDTATSVTQIDETEIKDRQAGTIAELIDSVPGVNIVNGATPHGSGINIRGLGATGTFGTDNKVLIIVDGIVRAGEELYRIGNQLFTDPALYKEAEVVRGPLGTFEYGSGAIGGMLVLETKDASDFTGGTPGFAYRQMLEFATNGSGITSSSILAWQPTEKLEFVASYIHRQLNAQTDGDGNVINPANDDTELPSWFVKGKLTFGDDDEHSLTAMYTETRSAQFDVPYDAFGLGVGFGNVDRSTSTKSAMLRYGYNPAGNDLIDLSFQISHNDEKIDQSPVIAIPPNPLLDADHRYRTTTVTLKNRALFDGGVMSHNLLTGVEFQHRDRTAATAAPGGENKRWALFAIDEMMIGDAWTITPALRYEHSKIEADDPIAAPPGNFSSDALSGGVSVRYAFQNGLALFSGVAYTEVLPPVDDLDFVTPPDDRINRNEKGMTYEIGASYEQEGVFRTGDQLAFKATLYHTDLWEVTSYVTNVAPPGPPIFVPIDNVILQGIELEGSYAMENGFYVDLNATVTDGSERSSALVTENWRLRAGDNIRLTLGKKFNDTYDLSWEMIGNSSVTNTFGRTEGYLAHNLRASITPKDGVWEGTEFRFGIENIFDQTYRTPLSTPNRFEAGRNFKFTLAKTF